MYRAGRDGETLKTVWRRGRDSNPRSLSAYTLSRRAPSTARTPLRNTTMGNNGGNPSSHTSAHESAATVAPFRAWRSSQPVVARGPERVAIDRWKRVRCPAGRAYYPKRVFKHSTWWAVLSSKTAPGLVGARRQIGFKEKTLLKHEVVK